MEDYSLGFSSDVMANSYKSAIENQHNQFFGCWFQQNPFTPVYLNKLLEVISFRNIIELGTHDGGLSILFALYCFLSKIPATCLDKKEPTLYKNESHHKTKRFFWTFDNVVRDRNLKLTLERLGGKFEVRDVLEKQEDIDYIGNLITWPGRTLLLCDNGNKPKEFNLYAPFLKPGDIIMAHDYAENEEKHKELSDNGYWMGWEINWNDIKESCEKYNILPIFKEEFEHVAWFCGVKQ